MGNFRSVIKDITREDSNLIYGRVLTVDETLRTCTILKIGNEINDGTGVTVNADDPDYIKVFKENTLNNNIINSVLYGKTFVPKVGSSVVVFMLSDTIGEVIYISEISGFAMTSSSTETRITGTGGGVINMYTDVSSKTPVLKLADDTVVIDPSKVDTNFTMNAKGLVVDTAEIIKLHNKCGNEVVINCKGIGAVISNDAKFYLGKNKVIPGSSSVTETVKSERTVEDFSVVVDKAAIEKWRNDIIINNKIISSTLIGENPEDETLVKKWFDFATFVPRTLIRGYSLIYNSLTGSDKKEWKEAWTDLFNEFKNVISFSYGQKVTGKDPFPMVLPQDDPDAFCNKKYLHNKTITEAVLKSYNNMTKFSGRGISLGDTTPKEATEKFKQHFSNISSEISSMDVNTLAFFLHTGILEYVFGMVVDPILNTTQLNYYDRIFNASTLNYVDELNKAKDKGTSSVKIGDVDANLHALLQLMKEYTGETVKTIQALATALDSVTGGAANTSIANGLITLSKQNRQINSVINTILTPNREDFIYELKDLK